MYVLLTLDLPGAPEEKRKKFYASLVGSHWDKFSHVDTVWRATFDLDDEAAIHKRVAKDLKDALRASGLTHCRAADSVSKSKPTYVPGFEPTNPQLIITR
jgi:uncharacterized protein YdaU (DUF1376 family)